MLQKAMDKKEHDMPDQFPKILEILLKDRASGRHIVWATDDYQELGDGYRAPQEMALDLIKKEGGDVIQPRSVKDQQNQLNRTKEKAEVFTPPWVCNAQNNLVDRAWFGREGIFNWESREGWTTNRNKIPFEDKGEKTWQNYVDSLRMEMACGEAPYLVSRYDAVSGAWIPVADRVGLLDRKLRVVCENAKDESEWYRWVLRAYQSIYGFEYQGDSLFLARENLLYTFMDYLDCQFGRTASFEELKEIAVIISWNLWQMDGLTFALPRLEGETGEPTYCVIKDWQAVRWKKKGILEYRSLIRNEGADNG